MHCKFCGFENGEDDHRCLRCGRRLSGVVISAPAGYAGANALAPALMIKDDTAEFAPVLAQTMLSQTPPAQTVHAQTMLFPSQAANAAANVIPFDRRERHATAGLAPPAVAPPISGNPRVAARKSSGLPIDTQGSLDFIQVSAHAGRKLKTDVEAQIFCNLPVATPAHRFVASAIDTLIILFGFGLIVILFEAMGGSFGGGISLWIGLAAALVLVSMFYGLIWAIAGRETVGMHLTDLQLITFDGFQLDARGRALRFASTWLSFCSAGLGLLWALADEENLTWHDHISKTFPTIREVPGTFVKQRL